MPWFNKEKYRAGEREAQSDVFAAQKALEGAQAEALGMLRDQLQKIQTMHHHIDLYWNQLLPNARQTVSAYQADYETNKTTLIQILTAENNLRELETMYNQDLTDYRIAIAELEALIGADLSSELRAAGGAPDKSDGRAKLAKPLRPTPGKQSAQENR
jgi:outer membrane protein TolC